MWANFVVSSTSAVELVIFTAALKIRLGEVYSKTSTNAGAVIGGLNEVLHTKEHGDWIR